MSYDNGSSLIVERCSVVLLVFSPLAVPAEGVVEGPLQGPCYAPIRRQGAREGPGYRF